MLRLPILLLLLLITLSILAFAFCRADEERHGEPERLSLLANIVQVENAHAAAFAVEAPFPVSAVHVVEKDRGVARLRHMMYRAIIAVVVVRARATTAVASVGRLFLGQRRNCE